ncbi:MAG: vitamin K epoxide reductase family protein, partial [Planctomycetota bacterium]
MSETTASTDPGPSSAGGPGRLLSAATLAVAFAGLFSAGVLGIAHLLDLPVPCGDSGGCITLAAHPASRIAGVPIAFLGVAANAVFIVLILRAHRSRRARRALAVLTGVGTVLSVGLLIYAQAVIHATCPWCIASGTAMLVLFVASTRVLRHPPALLRVRPAITWGLLYATGIALGVQTGLMVRMADAPPIPAERLAGLTLDELDDPAKSTGAPEAPVTIVMFSDFWCPACRAAHASLR